MTFVEHVAFTQLAGNPFFVFCSYTSTVYHFCLFLILIYQKHFKDNFFSFMKMIQNNKFLIVFKHDSKMP